MAQLGSAPALGAGGRRFESGQPDGDLPSELPRLLRPVSRKPTVRSVYGSPVGPDAAGRGGLGAVSHRPRDMRMVGEIPGELNEQWVVRIIPRGNALHGRFVS